MTFVTSYFFLHRRSKRIIPTGSTVATTSSVRRRLLGEDVRNSDSLPCFYDLDKLSQFFQQLVLQQQPSTTTIVRRCISTVAVKSSLLTTPSLLSTTTTDVDNKNHHHHHHHDSIIRKSNASLIPYHRSWAWQNWLLHQRLRSRRRQVETLQPPEPQQEPQQHNHYDRDMILLLEHDHVYTLGRGADENHLTFLQDDDHNEDNNIFRQRLSRTSRGPGSARLSIDSTILHSLQQEEQEQQQQSHDNEHEIPSQNNDNWNHQSTEQAVHSLSSWAMQTYCPVIAPNGVPIYRVERGGEVTYHGPGQLVVYPLLDLKHGHSQLQDDLHWFVRQIEQVIIQTLNHFDIMNATRDEIHKGVWVGHDKVATVGISASKWITTHGFALNVNPNLQYFDTSIILPCGIEGRAVTSIAQLLKQQQQSVPTIQEVASIVLQEMQNVFEIEIEPPQKL